MTRLATLALFFAPSVAFAFDKPKAYIPHAAPKVAPVNADVYDLLLLDKTRPYWIRFHVRFDGRPYTELWARALGALFADLDRDGDGFLDAAEFKRVPHSSILLQAMQSGYPYYAQWPTPPFKDLDKDGDGRVSRADLEAYYFRSNIPLARTVPAFNPDPYAEAINRNLFDLLDKNKDGKITPDEPAAAEAWLDKFDLDEDECLSLPELVPNLLTAQRGQARAVNPNVPPMIFARADAPVANLTQQFLTRYDADKDFNLSPAEIGLDTEAFAALDRNGNGKLDVPELADFFACGLPDLELRLAIDTAGAAAGLEKIVAKRRPTSVRAAGTYQIVAKLGRFEMTLGEPPTANPNVRVDAIRNNYRQTFTQQFLQAAAGKTYVDAAALQKPPGRNLLPFLVPADRNGDGKLTMQELAAHLEMLFRFADAPLGLTTFTTSPNWFTELDTNRDGRFSRMELRNAWKSLSARQPSAEQISYPDSGWALRPVLHRGPQAPFNYTQNYFNPIPVAAPTRGPLWFRKMDRNGDGFVSRREFLGAKAEFDRLDRNGDGLIDADEAEAAGK